MVSDVVGQEPWSPEAALRALEALPVEERLILPSLQRLQATFGYVPDEAIGTVAEFLNVSRAEVVGVLTYYHDLRQTPPPAVVVQVCVAEACQAQGVRDLVANIEREFGIALEAESHAGAVEFDKAYCLGDCALGPAIMVNGRLIGRCDVERVKAAVDAAQGVMP